MGWPPAGARELGCLVLSSSPPHQLCRKPHLYELQTEKLERSIKLLTVTEMAVRRMRRPGFWKGRSA